MLKEDLKPGKYYIYALIEPTRTNNYIPDIAALNVYSSFVAKLSLMNPLEMGNLLK